MARGSPQLPDPLTQYQVERRFKLYEHKAPARPKGRLQDMRFDEHGHAIEMEPNGRVEHCRRHALYPLTDSPSIEVTLKERLSVRLDDLHYSQVCKVECDGRAMVARFYDPLYALELSGWHDIFKQIDYTIALQASIFEALKDLQGTLVPRFIGCFLTMLENPDGSERGVQVVLLEFITGHALNSALPYPVCDDHKIAIVDAVLLANHLLVLRGIEHSDLAERNLILKDVPLSPHPFCSTPTCPLKHRLPTKSFVQQMDIPGQPAFDFSALTSNQLHLLPIAVIDFDEARLIDDLIAEGEMHFARFGETYGRTRKDFEDDSIPELCRESFLADLCEDSQWRSK